MALFILLPGTFDLMRRFGVTASSLPCLIVLDAAFNVVTTDGVANIHRDAHGLLFPWRPKPTVRSECVNCVSLFLYVYVYIYIYIIYIYVCVLCGMVNLRKFYFLWNELSHIQGLGVCVSSVSRLNVCHKLTISFLFPSLFFL